MASYALRHGFDKLVFIDADQSWDWEQLKQLLDSDKPIVAGVVPLKRYPLNLNFTPRLEDADCFIDDNKAVLTSGLNRLSEKYNHKEIEVQCMGTAFMAVDVAKVLAPLADSGYCPEFTFVDDSGNIKCWDFFQSGVVEGLYFGEDWGFCMMAKRLSISSFINPLLHIPHYGGHKYEIGASLIRI